MCDSPCYLFPPCPVCSGGVDWSHQRPSLYRSSISMAPVYSSPKLQQSPARSRINSYTGGSFPAQFSSATTSANIGNLMAGTAQNQYSISRQQTFTNSEMMGFLADLLPESSLDAHGGHAGVHGMDSGLGSSTSPHVTRRAPLSRSASLLGSLLGRKRRVTYTPVSQSELLDRFRKILVTATDLATMYRKY